MIMPRCGLPLVGSGSLAGWFLLFKTDARPKTWKKLRVGLVVTSGFLCR